MFVVSATYGTATRRRVPFSDASTPGWYDTIRHETTEFIGTFKTLRGARGAATRTRNLVEASRSERGVSRVEHVHTHGDTITIFYTDRLDDNRLRFARIRIDQK